MGFSSKAIVGLAGAVAIGILFNVLACIIKTDDHIKPNWWPILTVLTYCLAPFPIILTGANASSDIAQMWQNWSFFTSGWLVLTSFGIPVVMAIGKLIASGNCALSVVGSVVCYGTAVGSMWYIKKTE